MRGDDVVDDDLLHERQQRLDELAADRDAERDVRVLLVRLHVADEPPDPALLLRRRARVIASRCATSLQRAPAIARPRRARRRGRRARRATRRDRARARRCGRAPRPSRARRRAAPSTPAVVEREPDRAPVAGDRLRASTKPALDETVDDRGDRRLGDREPVGEQRRPLVARRDQGEHPELGEREVARRRGPLQRAGRERQGPGRPGAGRGRASHRDQDTEPLEAELSRDRRRHGAQTAQHGRQMRDAALGIDVGTTNVKVALVARRRHARSAGAQRPLPIDPRRRRSPSRTPSAMWAALVDGGPRGHRRAPDDAGDVDAIGVCSQYSSIVPGRRARRGRSRRC